MTLVIHLDLAQTYNSDQIALGMKFAYLPKLSNNQLLTEGKLNYLTSYPRTHRQHKQKAKY